MEIYSTQSDRRRWRCDILGKGKIITYKIVNRPTRITKTSASCIDHIYINSYFNQDILSGIIKIDLSDHFPIFIIDNNLKTDWSFILDIQDSNQAYNIFLKQFLIIYNSCFPMKTIEIKRKNLLSPWITRGLIKSSKRKQKLYVTFLKNKSYRNEQRYKQYKNLFEKIKINSKKKTLCKSSIYV